MGARRILQFDPLNPVRMMVDLEVSRMQRFPKEKAVRIWGYVGDYEVAITLPSDDGRVKLLAHQHKLLEQMKQPEPAS